MLGKTLPQRYLLSVILSIGVLAAQTAAPSRLPDVPFVPTTEKAVQEMLKLAGVKSSDVVYDLGCGDGRIVIAAAKTYGTHGVGIDIDPQRIKEAKENAKKSGVESLVRFEENDLFKADIHEATVVTLFLLPHINLKLLPKLQQDLKPGTRIVSNTFDMGDWKAEKETTVGQSGGTDDGDYTGLSQRLYLWTVPPAAKK
ncbi:MAG TPA: methyltransferase domain-containing protein [Bryobacteraceae bacterium]|nr:methyltransferase domain-containing protein [Bryobacteraceae bacterium]